MTARPVTVGKRDDRRHLRPTEIVGEWTAVDIDTRREHRSDQGHVARDREQRTLGLAHAVARYRVEQTERVRVARAVEHLGDGAFLDDLAGVHHADAIAHRADHAHVVGNEQDRRPGLASQDAHEIEYLGLDRGVEPGRGFVEHEQLGIAGQRHRDHDALQHAARQLMGIAVEYAIRVGDPYLTERLAGLRHRIGLVQAEQAERLGHLTTDPERRIHRLDRVLVHHRCHGLAIVAEFFGRHRRHVIAVDEHTPALDDGIRRQVTHRRKGRGRLAAARLTNQAERLARSHAEAHAAQYRARHAAYLVGDMQVFDGEGVERRRCVGHEPSMTDCTESAIRLAATTRLAIAIAGKNVDHQ